MSKVRVNGGICGFFTTIHAHTNEDELINVKFETDCPNFKGLEKMDIEVDPLSCCFAKVGEGEIYDLFKNCPHITCPVPCATLKAIEVEGGLALPKNVTIEIEK